MTDSQQLYEKRDHVRFQVGNRAFALFRTLWARSALVSQVKDISMGGLALHCVCVGGDMDEELKGANELMIVTSDHRFQLSGIPITIIWDIDTAGNCLAGITTRRCGVQFGELVKKQVHHLEGFIRAYTQSEAQVTPGGRYQSPRSLEVREKTR